MLGITYERYIKTTGQLRAQGRLEKFQTDPTQA